MAKLYPPYIEGTLPAFCLDSDGGGTIVIPFTLNRAVSKSEISDRIKAKIKTVQKDVLLGDNECIIDWSTQEAKINVSNYKAGDVNINIGQFYKIQVAFIDKATGNPGYYSTVGVAKCTGEPKITINKRGKDGELVELDTKSVNNNTNEYIGEYVQNVDITEKVYSSKFIITDLAGNEIANTGDVLHNVENNPDSYWSYDIMKFNRDLEFGKIYKIKYEVTTNNGLVKSSPEYLLTQQKSLSMELQGDLTVNLNYDEGYIDIGINGALMNVYIEYQYDKYNKDSKKWETVTSKIDEKFMTPSKLENKLNQLQKNRNFKILSRRNDGEEIGVGAFLLSREDTLNPGVWEELTRFALSYESPTKTIFRDFTIEQGKTYVYSIQQYNNNGIYSDRKKSQEIYADFEDIFLYDGSKQLKLRFNPQVSSLKTQLAETRSETIGSKYPFFYRNARVGYKTFPISGLISMESDNAQIFTTFEDILKETWDNENHNVVQDKAKNPDVYSHIWLKNKNYASERLFKLQVLDWFNDGKVKLFKSPGEGNYLVRLMDVSMSPENALGRMLHNVSATAYECAECNYENKIAYKIIEDKDTSNVIESSYVTNWREESINDMVQNISDYNAELIKELQKEPDQRWGG